MYMYTCIVPPWEFSVKPYLQVSVTNGFCVLAYPTLGLDKLLLFPIYYSILIFFRSLPIILFKLPIILFFLPIILNYSSILMVKSGQNNLHAL